MKCKDIPICPLCLNVKMWAYDTEKNSTRTNIEWRCDSCDTILITSITVPKSLKVPLLISNLPFMAVFRFPKSKEYYMKILSPLGNKESHLCSCVQLTNTNAGKLFTISRNEEISDTFTLKDIVLK